MGGGGGALYRFNMDVDMQERRNLLDTKEAPAYKAVMNQLLKRLHVLVSESAVPMTWFSPFQGHDYACARCPYGKPSGPLYSWLPWMH